MYQFLVQPFRREVLAKHAPLQIHLGELRTPKGVMFARIGVDHLRGTAMHGQIGLLVTLQIQSTERYGASNGFLIDRGGYYPTLPLDLLRKADTDGPKYGRRCVRDQWTVAL
jgi:hypothetical protein